jgi:hypothetical protein
LKNLKGTIEKGVEGFIRGRKQIHGIRPERTRSMNSKDLSTSGRACKG